MSATCLYVSTRGGSPAVTFSMGIAAGLAPDGGLYVPRQLPRYRSEEFDASGSLADTATTLLAPFFASDPLAAQLPTICHEALNFDTPLRALAGDPRGLVLELFHGPTAAFKDIGARFLANCLRRLQSTNRHPITILVATSGDTGAAVGAAFHRQPGVRVVILYPDQRVSPRQAHQLGSFGDNVQALRVAGTFDDCQRMVKAALGDETLQQEVPLSSANSISLGRLLPQMSYYAHSALAWWRTHGTALNFIVPTGNLGNALAAVWVREAGLPVGEIYLACNTNATLPDFFAGADYSPRAALATLANAMDVGAPSNFERLRWTLHDNVTLRRALRAQSVPDCEIQQTITYHARVYGDLLCPHTACAVHVLDGLRAAHDHKYWAVVATAHPAKFERVVEPLIEHTVQIPPALAAMLKRPSSAEPVAAEDEALKDWLRTRPRVQTSQR